MFEFTLRAAPCRRRITEARASLRFEGLEERVVANAAPSLGAFYVIQQLPNHQVVVVGAVKDESPTTVTVNFSGVATGSVHPDPLGRFTATLTCSELGSIKAVAVDDGGLYSRPALAMVTNLPPTIVGFTAVQGANDMWTFSGKVIDEAAQGLTVQLTSALPSLSAAAVPVGADGTFSYTVQLSNPLDQGTVSASCTDWWGATSNQVFALVQPA